MRFVRTICMIKINSVEFGLDRPFSQGREGKGKMSLEIVSSK